MNIDELVRQPGEWLRSAGPMSDVVISTRIRLARNLAGYPFLTRASPDARDELAELLRRGIHAAVREQNWSYFDITRSADLDRQVLVERHLISRQHAEAEGSRGVAVSPSETVALMVNEEDHLRMQSIRCGLQLDDVWNEISAIDDLLEERFEFAYHARYGYLTACPTNVGTGMRLSVMLHLPGLKLTNEIEKVLRAARDLHLAVRGLFGEGTDPAGDFFQISNQITLGRSELDIIEEFRMQIIPRVLEFEGEARRALLRDRSVALEDKIWRSFGALQNARSISSEETLSHLSHLRMGIHLGRFSELDLNLLNELFLLTQPAHLQKLSGGRLAGEDRGVQRAEFIRQRLNQN